MSLRIILSTANCDTAEATAYFDNSIGVEGYVVITTDGDVNVDLTIRPTLDTSICSGNAEPFTYHIHEIWALDSTNGYGTDCGKTQTGGHYNPYNVPACSKVKEPTYLNCEVGDLSGRFGGLTSDKNGEIQESNELHDGGCSLPEIGYKRSVVFHCRDGTRLFCAPFSLTNSSGGDDDDDDDDSDDDSATF
eukprot:257064_1